MKFWRGAALPDDEPVELAALADGSLAPQRRAALEAGVAASPELVALLAEQKRSLALVHRGSATVAAPAGLRTRIEAERRSRRRPRRKLVLGTGLAAAAATALALLFMLPDRAGGPSLAAVAELSSRGSTGPGPAPQSGQPKLLARAIGGVRFPSWQKPFGWQATGVRADRLAGRLTATVFYEKDGQRLGYTIVEGARLAVPGGVAVVERGGTELHTFVADGRLVVSWLRGGRTCVLSGSGVKRGVLLKLAAWKGKGAVPF